MCKGKLGCVCGLLGASVVRPVGVAWLLCYNFENENDSGNGTGGERNHVSHGRKRRHEVSAIGVQSTHSVPTCSSPFVRPDSSPLQTPRPSRPPRAITAAVRQWRPPTGRRDGRAIDELSSAMCLISMYRVLKTCTARPFSDTLPTTEALACVQAYSRRDRRSTRRSCLHRTTPARGAALEGIPAIFWAELSCRMTPLCGVRCAILVVSGRARDPEGQVSRPGSGSGSDLSRPQPDPDARR